MFRYVILGLLREAGACHGYALVKAFRARSGLHAATGNFYRELRRLVADGLIAVCGKADGSDLRRTYKITPAGAQAFDTWLVAAAAPPPGQYDDELSARTLFLARAEAAVVQRMLTEWREVVWMRSKTLEHQREVVRAPATRGDARAFSVLPLLLKRRLRHVATDLEFLDDLCAAYEAWAAPRRGGHAHTRPATVVRDARSTARQQPLVQRRASAPRS